MKYCLMVLLLMTIRAEAKDDMLAPPPINFSDVKFNVDGKIVELKWNGEKMDYSEYFPKKWDEEDPTSAWECPNYKLADELALAFLHAGFKIQILNKHTQFGEIPIIVSVEKEIGE